MESLERYVRSQKCTFYMQTHCNLAHFQRTSPKEFHETVNKNSQYFWSNPEFRFIFGTILFQQKFTSILFQMLQSDCPRTQLEENCELQGTDNVQERISEHIFVSNGGYCVYYPSNIFRDTHSFENWGISLGYSPVLVGEYSIT